MVTEIRLPLRARRWQRAREGRAARGRLGDRGRLGGLWMDGGNDRRRGHRAERGRADDDQLNARRGGAARRAPSDTLFEKAGALAAED